MQNEEADQLTNNEFHNFDAKKRIPVELDGLQFQVLPQLFAAGEEYLEDLEKAKAAAKNTEAVALEGGARKKLKGDKGLRETDPW